MKKKTIKGEHASNIPRTLALSTNAHSKHIYKNMLFPLNADFDRTVSRKIFQYAFESACQVPEMDEWGCFRSRFCLIYFIDAGNTSIRKATMWMCFSSILFLGRWREFKLVVLGWECRCTQYFHLLCNSAQSDWSSKDRSTLARVHNLIYTEKERKKGKLWSTESAAYFRNMRKWHCEHSSW